jgi:hypothetical protein
MILGLLLLQVLGCADFAGWVRQYTYPPTFHYISTEQLRSTMWHWHTTSASLTNC